MRSKLLLFDVDWTLVNGPGEFFIEAHRVGLKKVFGFTLEKDFNIVPHEGKIGKQFVRDLAIERGVDSKTASEKAIKVISIIDNYLQKNINKWKIVVLPGVKQCLKKLKEEDFILGLLTGNSKRAVEIRLKKINLYDFFKVGAFGNESFRRVSLIDIAKKRAEKIIKEKINRNNIYIIGDTWRDIVCGKQGRVKTVAVASGPHPIKLLKKYKPDLLLNSLRETKKLIDFIKID